MDSVSPAARRRVRSTWVARSPSPSRNQFSPPSACKRLHEGPGLVAPAPALGRIVEAGEGVEQRVDVGRDMKAEMDEIIAGVRHHGEKAGGEHAVEPERQLGAAYAAGERQHPPLDRSSEQVLRFRPHEVDRRAGRAGGRQSAHQHHRAPSPACPISSEAPAAISSA